MENGCWRTPQRRHRKHFADANGGGTITLTTEEWNIGSGDPTKVFWEKD
jgi:hypothetical protein